MILSDLAKYSMTRSIAQSVCGSWASFTTMHWGKYPLYAVLTHVSLVWSSDVVLENRPWPRGASISNFCGLGLGFDSCIDNFSASTSNLRPNNYC